MTAIRLVPYEAAAAPHVGALWWRAIGERYPLREEVLRACLDGNPSYRPGDALLAWEAERLVGFGYLGLLRESEPETIDQRDRAWLQAVIVDPDRRRQGIGRAIVRGLAEIPAGQGIETVEAGGGFFYLWPGLPADLPEAQPFAEAVGFEVGDRTWDLRGDVAGLGADVIAAAAEAVSGAGMRVVAAGGKDRDALLAFIVREFGSEWWHDTRWFLDEGGDPGDVQLLRDGADHIQGFVRLHTPETRPIGPPHFWTALRPPASGGLGPIGVATSQRGRGLGRALLVLGLDRLRVLGLHDVVIDFTHLLGFYGPLGFGPWMEFRHARASTSALRAGHPQVTRTRAHGSREEAT